MKSEEFDWKKVRVAMFDMDGVLFDSMPNHARSWHETLKHFGLTMEEAEAYLHEGRTGASTINIVCKRERGREATEEEIREIYAYKTRMFSRLPEAQAMPYALEVLQCLKDRGILTMVVTGSGQRTLLDKLQRSFPGIFKPEWMVTAFDVERGKPDPEPYLMGLQKASDCLGRTVRAEEAVVVENAPLGIRAGVAAGVFTIALNTGPLPDRVLLDAGAGLLLPSMKVLFEKTSPNPSKGGEFQC